MAVLQGRNGQIKIVLPTTSGVAPTAPSSTYASPSGSVILGDIRSWSVEESVETVDATTMSTTTGFIFRDVLPSFKAWTATADVLLDPATTNLDVGSNSFFRSGETVNLYIYPAGDGAGSTDLVYWGQALITSKSQSASFDGLIEVSITFEGRKDLYVAETA